MSFLSSLKCIAATLAVALWFVLPVQAGNSHATDIAKSALSGLDLVAQADGDSDSDSEDSDYDSDSDSDSDSEGDSDADSDEDSDDSDTPPAA